MNTLPGGQKPKDTGYYRQIRDIGTLTLIPVLMVTGPLVGYWAGSWIDRRTGKEPWFMVLFFILGLVASAKEVSKLIRRIARGSDHDGV